MWPLLTNVQERGSISKTKIYMLNSLYSTNEVINDEQMQERAKSQYANRQTTKELSVKVGD